MTIKNSKTFLSLFLLSLYFIPSLLLLYTAYTTPKDLEKISGYHQELSQFNELALNISQLTSNAESYILYADPQYLSNFRKYSVETIKKELELSNIANSAQKRKIEELLNLSNGYLSFVEKEVIPSLELHNQEDYRLQLLEQHRKLASQLESKLNLIITTSKESLNQDFQNSIIREKNQGYIVLLVALSSLTVLVLGTYWILWPLIIQYYFLYNLYKQSKNATIIVDSKGIVKNINNAAENLFSISNVILKDKPLDKTVFLFPQLQNVAQPLFNVILKKKALINHQTTYINAENNILLTVDYHPLFIFNRLTGAALTVHPVEVQKDKRFLSDAIEAERKTISIEIHDWIGRYMSSIIHSLDYILRLDREFSDQVQEKLINLRVHCQNAAMDMRSIMNDIHPYLIDKVGLIAALESHIANFEKINNIKVYIFYQDRSLKLDTKEEIFIYRIVQESLSNVAKHSNATEVDIYFNVHDNTLKIEIIDNGNLEGQHIDAGKGLWGMKDRANLIGGDLVYGTGESGFYVTLTVPLTWEEGSK